MQVEHQVHLISMSLREVNSILGLNKEEVYSVILVPEELEGYKGKILFEIDEKSLLKYLAERNLSIMND